jgi:hypothetical protein
MGRQNNKGKIRPGRLIAHPAEEGGEISGEKGLFGH